MATRAITYAHISDHLVRTVTQLNYASSDDERDAIFAELARDRLLMEVLKTKEAMQAAASSEMDVDDLPDNLNLNSDTSRSVRPQYERRPWDSEPLPRPPSPTREDQDVCSMNYTISWLTNGAPLAAKVKMIVTLLQCERKFPEKRDRIVDLLRQHPEIFAAVQRYASEHPEENVPF